MLIQTFRLNYFKRVFLNSLTAFDLSAANKLRNSIYFLSYSLWNKYPFHFLIKLTKNLNFFLAKKSKSYC